MIKAILFDLDGTLLNVDMDIFIKSYLKKLSSYFAGLVGPAELTEAILVSTKAMIENTDPGKTNQEVFMAEFFNRIKHPPEVFMPMLDEFYRKVFPELRELTEPCHAACESLDTALAKGYRIVLATNPIFPRLAIRHRMSWANIEEYPFSLVTTYENMHFCKPNPQYYLEIASRLNLDPGECLMVGNDLRDDIQGARAAGMKTYLVENMVVNSLSLDVSADYSGKAEELPGFLRTL